MTVCSNWIHPVILYVPYLKNRSKAFMAHLLGIVYSVLAAHIVVHSFCFHIYQDKFKKITF